MTISTTASETTVTGNSLTTIFSYDFPMGGTSSYAQLIMTTSTGVTSSISASLFSVSGVTSSTGGTFTYPLSGSAITSGISLTLKRVVPLVQDTSISNQGVFAPAITEGALDYATMALQQLQQEIEDLQARVDALE